MERTKNGSLLLFRAWGIDVSVHWSWFLVAIFQISTRRDMYGSPYWKIIEYLCLFGLVLAHEFGHALACRSVGGIAKDIILWPLGGIAFVQPPARPGALLWSILAGPLVNLVLIAPFGLAAWLVPEGMKDLRTFFGMLTLMNVVLFVFNMIPIYPLDGGQALHALLWYGLGRWKSLQIVSLIGGVFGVGLFGLVSILAIAKVISLGSLLMIGLMAVFIALQSAASYQVARHVLFMNDLPRHTECACPSCYTAPPRGLFWVCEECQTRFDTFETRGKCPSCGAWYLATTCPHCRDTHHIDRWYDYRPGAGLAARPAEPEESAR